MSVTVTRGEGVAVLTLTSDPQAVCPPLCQVLGGLCYTPGCCSVAPPLKNRRSASTAVLGALQVLVGVLTVSLAVLLCLSPGSWWRDDYTAFPFWLGGLFVSFGVVNILTERFPSPCLLLINVLLQLLGCLFSVASIVLFIINTADVYIWNACGEEDYDYWRRRRTTPSPAPEERLLMDKCQEMKEQLEVLVTGLYGVLIVLSVLELCVVISSSVMAVRTLRSLGRDGNKSSGDPEQCRPLVD